MTGMERHRTGMGTTVVTTIALCTLCNQAKNVCLTSLKMRKYFTNVHKMGGVHVQCVNSHYAKFEYKGIKTVGVTD